MIPLFKYFLSLPRKSQIVDVGEIARHSRHIAVIYPMYEDTKTVHKRNLAKLIKDEFTGCKTYAIIKEGRVIEDFDNIVSLKPEIVVFSRKFFKTRESLRNLHIDISFDLNENMDLITYLVGASLRVGTVESPFFNVIVKGARGNPDNMFSIFANYSLKA